MQIDALLFPPSECHGNQKDPLLCDCLRNLALGILSSINNGHSTLTVDPNVVYYPIERGIKSPSYLVPEGISLL